MQQNKKNMMLWQLPLVGSSEIKEEQTSSAFINMRHTEAETNERK